MSNLTLMRLDSKLNLFGRYYQQVGGKYLIFPLPFERKRHPSEAVATLETLNELKNYADAITKS